MVPFQTQKDWSMQKESKKVDAYIAKAPKESREKLTELRTIITSVAPEAQERLSYGMPYYDYHGRLAYFAAHVHHIGLYIPPPVIEEHKKNLKHYETTKATVRFPIDKPLPVTVIKGLIKTRMKKNRTMVKTNVHKN